MTSHTPGPWCLGPEEKTGFRIFGKGATIYFAESAPLNETDVSPKTFREWREEQKANARLIASAPDLASELAKALTKLQRCFDNADDCPEGTGEVLESGYALLEKALGAP